MRAYFGFFGDIFSKSDAVFCEVKNIDLIRKRDVKKLISFRDDAENYTRFC